MLAKTILLVPRLGRRRRSQKGLSKRLTGSASFVEQDPTTWLRKESILENSCLGDVVRQNQSCNGWTSVGEDNQVISLH
jgi:hypothetical protein